MLHCSKCSYDLCGECQRTYEQPSRSELSPGDVLLASLRLEMSPVPGPTQLWGRMPSSPCPTGLSRSCSLELFRRASSKELGGLDPAPAGASHPNSAWLFRQKSAGPGAAVFHAFAEGAASPAPPARHAMSPCASPIRPVGSPGAHSCGGNRTASQVPGPTQLWGGSPEAAARESGPVDPRRRRSISPTLRFRASPSVPALERELTISPTQAFQRAASPVRQSVSPKVKVRGSPSGPVLQHKRTISPTQVFQRAASPIQPDDGPEPGLSRKRAISPTQAFQCIAAPTQSAVRIENGLSVMRTISPTQAFRCAFAPTQPADSPEQVSGRKRTISPTQAFQRTASPTQPAVRPEHGASCKRALSPTQVFCRVSSPLRQVSRIN